MARRRADASDALRRGASRASATPGRLWSDGDFTGDHADTAEARTGDTTRRDAAFASGAQIVSTDYEVEDPRWPGFVTDLPGDGPARCNPVSAPEGCEDAAFDDG